MKIAEKTTVSDGAQTDLMCAAENITSEEQDTGSQSKTYAKPNQSRAESHERELSKLADQIKADIAALDDLAQKSAKRSIALGEKLLRAKKLVKHQNFEPWLKKEFGWSRRTAERHMRRARRLQALEEPKATTLSHLLSRATMSALDDLLDLAEQSNVEELQREVAELDATGADTRLKVIAGGKRKSASQKSRRQSSSNEPPSQQDIQMRRRRFEAAVAAATEDASLFEKPLVLAAADRFSEVVESGGKR